MLTLFLHGISDTLYEGGKVLYYTKLQNNQVNFILKILHRLIWIIFVISWFITRLYIFPLNVLVFVIQQFQIHNINRPSFPLLVGLSWIVCIMNIYWFTVILLLKKTKSRQF